MPAEVSFEFTNQASNRRRVRFVRRQPGGWSRVEEELDGGEWRAVGQEIVSDFVVGVDRGASDAVVVSDEPAGEVVTGP